MADTKQPESIQMVLFNAAPAPLKREMALLQRRAYPDADQTLDELPPPTALTIDDEVPRVHDAALDAISFYSRVGSTMISYAGVVRKTISHDGQQFAVAGLSCVMTDKDYWGRGFGSQTVVAATRWIEHSDTDFGIFTCDPPLAPFYERAGSWPVVPDVVLIGSAEEGALCSADLGKAVLMRLFSQKARSSEKRLRNTTINLDLPLGQFL